MPEQIGKTPIENPEMVRKLRDFQKAIEEFIRNLVANPDEAKESEFVFFVQIAHTESGMTVYTGQGCPVCSIINSIKWCIENDIRHDETNLPLGIPVFRKAKKTPKSEIN